ncbi:PilW family protein [Alteromonas antoniana]|uniref:PilW family protein n=1 Tax=Alteromonas antoniana TaxID=2803813 RepID=UPI001C43B7DE|nr:PilW family protein [Alteromonas antoniana]
MSTRNYGFSLVELMISLLLGTIITGAIIQVLVSSQVTNNLNQAVAEVQESGRFISIRLTKELIEAGRYDSLSASIDKSVDTVVEEAWVQNRPIALPGDFAASAELGSIQGASGANDSVVISMLDTEDCAGNQHGYGGDEFHVVNHFQVSGEQLTCTGYDGRVLRGLKASASTSSSVVLLDNVNSFQLQYGVSDRAETSLGQPITYVTAEALPALRDNFQQVVAIRFGLLLSSYDDQVTQTVAPEFAVLNENKKTLDKQHYYQVFTKTVALRNVKNFVRSSR